jgi:hypothetical protein
MDEIGPMSVPAEPDPDLPATVPDPDLPAAVPPDLDATVPDPDLVEAELIPQLTAAEASFSQPAANRQSLFWLGFLLAALSLVGCVAVLPFSYMLLKDSPAMRNLPAGAMPFVLGFSVAIEFLFSVVAIALGLWVGPKLGLIPPLLHPAPPKPDARDLANELTGLNSGWRWRVVGLSLASGALLGAIIAVAAYFANPAMPTPPTPLPKPGPVTGMLASIGAGIREEVWMRLGILTIVASFGASLSRSKRLGPISFWSANLIAAALFAAIHIPQAITLLGMNMALLGVILIGNGVPGLVFGWLYRRYGLVSAMLSHFMLDVVLKVILPALNLD